ncbi:MAG TPA: hypothetical protein VFQ39_02640 [Longimicrobium sp.]|nr:hypothetical protein [Longimicrobium sp.]
MGEPAIDLSELPPSVRRLIEQASRGAEVLVKNGDQEVAKIIPLHPPRAARRPGSAAGLIHMAEDFDATPDELKDYF